MSGLFKKKKTPAPEEISTEEQREARGILGRYMQYGRQARGPEVYPGELTAPLEPYEREVPGILTGYIGRDMPEMWDWGRGEVKKTMLGGYDPYTSDYYKALRRGVLEEGEESKIRMRQASQIGGMLRSTGRMGMERDIEEDIRTELADLSAGLMERERERRLQTLPYIMTMGQLEEAAPLRSLQAIQQFTQRPYYQSELDRLYQEYQRQLAEEKFPLQIAQMLASPQMYQFYQPSYQQSPFQQYVMPLAQTAMLASAMGGGLGMLGGNIPTGATSYGGGSWGMATPLPI